MIHVWFANGQGCGYIEQSKTPYWSAGLSDDPLTVAGEELRPGVLTDLRGHFARPLEYLARCRVVVINDIDKIGKMTEAREEHFFDLIDGMHSRDAEFLVPSNISLNDFCLRMGGEDLFIKRDGLGPMQRRLRELCKQIHVGEHNGK